MRALLVPLVLAAALPALPQTPDNPFTRRALAAPSGEVGRTVVSADRRALPCLDALRYLADAMNWNLRVDSEQLADDLRHHTVDLALGDEDPRLVGQLVAVAAGLDLILDNGDPGAGLRPTMHLTRRPDPRTESGRFRLRQVAARWYGSFLVDELRHEPLVAEESSRVRMQLAGLLVENGDLEGAIPMLAAVSEREADPRASAAVLRLAQIELELAGAEAPRAAAHYERAEQWARRLLEAAPDAAEARAATVALGRALLGQADLAVAAGDAATARELCQRCRTELAARVMRLLGGRELAAVWLLVGEAERRLEAPDRVFEAMTTLRAAPGFDDLTEPQRLDYHYLLGYGALAVDELELAMRSLEWFLIHAGADRRRGAANVLLADAYLQLGRFTEARAAAVAAREQFHADLTPEWRVRALRLWARTALAIGDRETAFAELEGLAGDEQPADVVLLLVDELIADRQWQRAIANARPLVSGAGAAADQARYKTAVAMYEQAVAGGNLDEFVTAARDLAPRIADRELGRRCAELIGDAYTQLGRFEDAADAYRGILR